ncbi:MAG: biopolymer transporter ExbD [Gammaproteobacteria bacterium]|nr:biopolymer transporter ExbD [Gammaproteobacteria bacterium]
MQFEGRRRTSKVPNLTPLIDIVFLLLVFFMLTSHFVRESVIDIDLPVADSGKSIDDDKQLEVVIDAMGHVRINDKMIEPEQIEAALREGLSNSSDKVVRVRGDQAAALGRAVTILDASRKAGAQAVDIVAERK